MTLPGGILRSLLIKSQQCNFCLSGFDEQQPPTVEKFTGGSGQQMQELGKKIFKRMFRSLNASRGQRGQRNGWKTWEEPEGLGTVWRKGG